MPIKTHSSPTHQLHPPAPPTIEGSQQHQRLLGGAQPHAGNHNPLLRVVGQVAPVDRAPLHLLVPAIGSKAVDRESRDHNDEVHHNQPVGEVRPPVIRGGGEGRRGGEERED